MDVLPPQQEIGEDLGGDGQALPPPDRHRRRGASRSGCRARPIGRRPASLGSPTRTALAVLGPALEQLGGLSRRDRIPRRDIGQADQGMRPQEALDDRGSRRLRGWSPQGGRAHRGSCHGGLRHPIDPGERRPIERLVFRRDPAPGVGWCPGARSPRHAALAAVRPGTRPSARRSRRRSGRRAGGGARPSLRPCAADGPSGGAGCRPARWPGDPARRDPRRSRRGVGARAGPRRPRRRPACGRCVWGSSQEYR